MVENEQLETEQTQLENQTEQSSSTSDNKTFTQAELDNIIAKRLAREKKSWETSLDEEKKKQNMSEVEKLIAERDEAINKVNERMKTANEKLLKADFKSVANELGIVDSDVAFMLIDKTELQDEDGNVNVEEMKKSLETLISQKPYLKGQTQQQQFANLPGSPAFKNSGTLTKEQLRQMKPEQIAKLSQEVINQALRN